YAAASSAVPARPPAHRLTARSPAGPSGIAWTPREALPPAGRPLPSSRPARCRRTPLRPAATVVHALSRSVLPPRYHPVLPRGTLLAQPPEMLLTWAVCTVVRDRRRRTTAAAVGYAP